jgi:hypothetical protein
MACSRYDDWQHYRDVLQPTDKKAVDVVAARFMNRPPECWLIEVKDFRQIRGSPGQKNEASELPATVADKVFDTIAGLTDAAANAEDADEKAHASRARRASRTVVVLHLEVASPSKLFPRVPNPANIHQKLRAILSSRAVGNLDPDPVVASMARPSGLPWRVS